MMLLIHRLVHGRCTGNRARSTGQIKLSTFPVDGRATGIDRSLLELAPENDKAPDCRGQAGSQGQVGTVTGSTTP